MTAAANLARLVAAAARWPADWTPAIDDDGEWTGAFLVVGRHGDTHDADTGHEVETGPGTGYSVDLGRFLADAVNAIPTILALIAELDSLRAHVEVQDARIKGPDIALAKVSL